MTIKITSIFTSAVLAVFSLGIQAAVITDLYSTGLDDNGQALSVGQIDNHYTLNTNAPTRVTSHPAYLSNSANSQWLQFDDGHVTRSFSTTFDLTGFDLSTVSIDGLWGVDNQGLDILLNGISTGTTLPGVIFANFQSLTSFTINSGFIAGINTLEFVVQNNGGPGAFRAELSGTGDYVAASVPETSSYVLLILGLGALGLMRKRLPSQ